MKFLGKLSQATAQMTKMTMNAILFVKFLTVNKNFANSYRKIGNRRRCAMFYGYTHHQIR